MAGLEAAGDERPDARSRRSRRSSSAGWTPRWTSDSTRSARPEAKELRGKAAIANARLAYELFEKRFDSPRWQALADRGARVQRPLWASTSTKDPSYRDTMYVEDLVAPHTVNTMPEATMHAMADHGQVHGNTIDGTYDEARAVFADLEKLGISYDDVVAVLEDEGVQKFADSWAELLATHRRAAATGTRRPAQEIAS